MDISDGDARQYARDVIQFALVMAVPAARDPKLAAVLSEMRRLDVVLSRQRR